MAERKRGPAVSINDEQVDAVIIGAGLAGMTAALELLDSNIAERELAISGAAFNREVRDKKVFAFLARLVFGSRGLVRAFVAHCRQYRGDRLRTRKNARIFDARALPLIAIRLQVLTRKSLGGRVLDAHERPLAGLYAIGEAAGFGGGGIHGKRALEGTFLGGCILTGRFVAEAIVHGRAADGSSL